VQELLLTYYQALAADAISGDTKNSSWNGFVLCFAHLAGAIASFVPARVNIELLLRGHMSLVASCVCIVCSGLLLVLAMGSAGRFEVPALLFFVAFIIAYAAFEFNRTLVGAQLGVFLNTKGCNLFLSVMVLRQLCLSAFQSVLQGVVTLISHAAGSQTLILAAVLLSLGIFLCIGTAILKFCCRSQVQEVPIAMPQTMSLSETAIGPSQA
jgi:hypothetical protein